MGNKDERMELLRHFMQERPVSHDVIDYLASHVTENIRRLKAVVAQLFTMSELTSGSVTLDMARVVALADTDGGYNGVIIEKNELEEIDATRDMADRFKKMLSVAESEEEQALALQIALGERIRQLRKSGEDPEGLARLESSLDILREGRLEEAISCITS
jgi:chromosomal replication initiation ATPase DnaA